MVPILTVTSEIFPKNICIMLRRFRCWPQCSGDCFYVCFEFCSWFWCWRYCCGWLFCWYIIRNRWFRRKRWCWTYWWCCCGCFYCWCIIRYRWFCRASFIWQNFPVARCLAIETEDSAEKNIYYILRSAIKRRKWDWKKLPGDIAVTDIFLRRAIFFAFQTWTPVIIL